MTEAKDRKANPVIDLMFWLIIVGMIAAGVWANYHYQMIDTSYRVIAWVVLVVVASAMTLLTSQGKKAFEFAKAARGELFKVVWPTRQEVVRMTMIVIALVILLSLIIWGLDSFLFWAVGLLTGQRG